MIKQLNNNSADKAKHVCEKMTVDSLISPIPQSTDNTDAVYKTKPNNPINFSKSPRFVLETLI